MMILIKNCMQLTQAPSIVLVEDVCSFNGTFDVIIGFQIATSGCSTDAKLIMSNVRVLQVHVLYPPP